MAGLLDGLDRNNFGSLTEEQRRKLERDAVSTEMPAWMDLLIGGGIGGGIGRQVGRGIGRAGEVANDMMFPTLSTMAGMAGHNANNLVNWAGRVGAGVGTMGGLGAAFDVARDRADRNTLRDAEGQPGGFYGPSSPMDAEGQPGGFYGRSRRR